MDWAVLSIWIQVGLTLIIFSFLYRDNPLYKFAEHLFVGLGTGYYIVQQYHGTFLPNLWRPFTDAITGNAETSGGALAWDFALVIPRGAPAAKRHAYYAFWARCSTRRAQMSSRRFASAELLLCSGLSSLDFLLGGLCFGRSLLLVGREF